MEIDLVDFLPKYPNITQSDNDILNPYGEDDSDFNKLIYSKNEFYTEKLSEKEDISTIPGNLLKHQIIISRFFSSYTQYDQLLLIHEMGSGKTCTAVSAIEKIKNEKTGFQRAMIFASGKGLLNNFVNELVFKCTNGIYIPENYEKLTELEKTVRVNKSISHFYDLNTFEIFAKELKTLSDESIRTRFSNSIIVIDEVHNLRIQEHETKINIYKQFHRFLHTVQNCKILLLSGTPIKDTPDEIASVMNLILPMEQQLPVKGDFIEEFMREVRPGEYSMKKSKIPILKNVFKGRVSFLKVMQSNIPKVFKGKHMGTLRYFNVVEDRMSVFQSEVYRTAYLKDLRERKGVYSQSRQASLFVFPDGTYGAEGWKNYILESSKKSAFVKLMGKKGRGISSFSLSKQLITELKKGGDSEEQMLATLGKYSSKYAAVIANIIKARNEGKNAFVYGEFVKGSGIILFSLILNLFGFSRANGKEETGDEKPRYGLLSNLTSSPKEINTIIKRFNQPDNMNGGVISVLIGSALISEGFSFFNIQVEEILTPWFNYSETAQVIARGLRLGSHKMLEQDGQSPIVNIYQRVSVPNERVIKKGLDKKEITETKKTKKPISQKTKKKGKGGEEQESGNEEQEIEDEEEGGEEDGEGKDGRDNRDEFGDVLQIDDNVLPSIDLEMYQLSEKKDKTIESIKKIAKEAAFDCALNYRRNYIPGYDGLRECEYSNCDYVCDGIDIKEGDDELSPVQIDYSTYQLYYNDRTVERIIMKIQDIFKYNFRMTFTDVYDHFQDQTIFDVISALRRVINENIIIYNSYGFRSYLREENNIYFLIDNLSASDSLMSNYYTVNPTLKSLDTYKSVMIEVNKQNVPAIIEKIFTTTDIDELKKYMSKLSIDVKEQLIEGSLLARELGIDKNVETRGLILEYFKNFYAKYKTTWISWLLESTKDIIRCLNSKTREWSDCTEKYEEKMKEIKKSIQGDIINNKYGYYGLFSKEENKFWIRDMTIEDKDKKDKQRSGKVCTTWDKADLLKLTNKVLNIPIGDDIYRQGENIVSMRKEILSNKYLSKMYKASDFNKDSGDEMRRILYFASKKKDDLCNILKDWFTKNNLLVEEVVAGKKGKKKA